MFKKIFGITGKIFSLRNIALMLLVLVLVVAAALYYGMDRLWEENDREVRTGLEKYQSAVISNEVEVLSSRLVKYVVQGRELARSRIFRSSIAKLSSTDRKARGAAREDFANFIKVSGFSAAFLFDLDGRLFAASHGQLDGEESDYSGPVEHVAQSHTPYFSTLREQSGELVSELFLPVFPADAISKSVKPVKVLALTIPLTGTLRSLLATGHGLEYDSRIRLVQQMGNSFQETLFSYPDDLKLEPVAADLNGVSGIEFGKRGNLQNDALVYSSAGYIPAIGWWVIVESDAAAVAEKMDIFKGVSALIAALALGAFIFFLLTLNFIASSRRYYVKCRRMEDELIPVRREKELLSKICNTLPTPVSLKDSESGAFHYINKAFADLAGLKHRDTEGLTDNQVFDSRDAEELSHGDQMVSMSGSPYSQELDITNGLQKTAMQVQGIPFTLEEDNDAILTIFRDVSSEKEGLSRSIEIRQQIINALVRAVENVPFLDGHTSLMRLMAVQIADTLLLSDADLATVEAAAILSQVGKTFIPKEIMEKEGKLTPEELLETQKYVEHTCRILDGIKFDLPITQTIWQIQENLDGSGYPNGLKGREISLLARILGVTNTFSALVQHRSYRRAKTAREAVSILQSMADKKFDGSVIDALDAVIHSQSGKEILQQSNVEI